MKPSTVDQAKGKFHEVKGTVKEKVGRATNDPDLEGEGQGFQVVPVQFQFRNSPVHSGYVNTNTFKLFHLSLTGAALGAQNAHFTSLAACNSLSTMG